MYEGGGWNTSVFSWLTISIISIFWHDEKIYTVIAHQADATLAWRFVTHLPNYFCFVLIAEIGPLVPRTSATSDSSVGSHSVGRAQRGFP